MAEAKKTNFEDGLKQLETVVRTLESEGLTLEASLVEFEKGVALAKELQSQLEQAKRKVEVLKQNLQGEMTTEPLGGDD